MAKGSGREGEDAGGGKGVFQRLAPLAWGLLAAVLLGFTLLAAAVLGMEEQDLVAVAAPSATATETATAEAMPTATRPSSTPSPPPIENSPTWTPSPSPVPPSATPQATVQARCVPPSNWRLYTVQRGESVSSLAWRYWTSAESLVQANCLKSYAVVPGQHIYIPNIEPRQSCGKPSGWFAYLIQRGDTLSSIARRVGTTLTALKQANCLKGDMIYAGATLWVPRLPSPPPTSSPRPTRAPVNHRPVAVADSYRTVDDAPLTVSAPGVLGNDTDPDGDTLTASLVGGPSHGTLDLKGNGSFTYNPASGYFGSDSFSYHACDPELLCDEATVSIEANQSPVAVADSYNTEEDTPLTVSAPGVLGNDTDPDGDALTASLVSGPSHGTLDLKGNGSFTYNPTNGYYGSDSFSYHACDPGGFCDEATVSIQVTEVTPVNHQPVAAGDSYNTEEDKVLTVSAPGVLSNDTDPDGDTLTASPVSGPNHGELALNANGGFTYNPASGYSGSDSFAYQACDPGGLCADATVSIQVTEVTPVNHQPVAVADSYNTEEDTPLTVSAPGVLGNDTDPDGDALTASLLSNPHHGTLDLKGNGGFTYNPTNGYFGSDSFSYHACDPGGFCDEATVSIQVTEVTPVNHQPVAAGDSYSTEEDKVLTVSAPGVLSNDTDPDGDALTASPVSRPNHGELTLNANGGFTYDPASGYSGSDSFRYRACDPGGSCADATVSIDVTEVNTSPAPAADSHTGEEATTFTPLPETTIDSGPDEPTTLRDPSPTPMLTPDSIQETGVYWTFPAGWASLAQVLVPAYT